MNGHVPAIADSGAHPGVEEIAVADATDTGASRSRPSREKSTARSAHVRLCRLVPVL